MATINLLPFNIYLNICHWTLNIHSFTHFSFIWKKKLIKICHWRKHIFSLSYCIGLILFWLIFVCCLLVSSCSKVFTRMVTSLWHGVEHPLLVLTTSQQGIEPQHKTLFGVKVKSKTGNCNIVKRLHFCFLNDPSNYFPVESYFIAVDENE